MRLPFLNSLLFVLLLLGGEKLGAQDQRESAPETAPDVAQLIEGLSDPRYRYREEATEKLMKLGQPAMVPVIRAALGENPERRSRGRRILKGFLDAFDSKTMDELANAYERASWGSAPKYADRVARLQEQLWQEARNDSAGYFTKLGVRVQRNVKGLSSLAFGRGWKGVDKDVRHILRFPELVTVNVSDTNVGDEAMRYVALLPKLDKLFLGRTKVGRAGVVHLQAAPRLKYISLQYLKIGDEEAVAVAPMVGLEHLGFDYTEVKDEGLKHVAGLKELKTLWLNGSEMSGKGLVHLKELPKLNKLVLARSPFNDKGMKYLRVLKQVEQLGLDETSVTSEGLVHLEELPNLKRLWLNKTSVDDKAIPSLAKLKNLENLYIPDCKFTEKGIERLKKLLPNCEVNAED